jgi:hypothetical protein
VKYMASETYLRATRAMTVQLDDGRTVFVEGGGVVREGDLSEFLRDRIGSDDPHYSSLFDGASQSDYDNQDVVGYHDPAAEAMQAAEALSRERSNFSREERFGDGPPVDIPVRLDPGRTLPESGADTPAADRFADKGQVTEDNEWGRDKAAQLEELGVERGETMEEQGRSSEMIRETNELPKQERKHADQKAQKENPQQKGSGEPSDSGTGTKKG